MAYNTELIDTREIENFSIWELTKPNWKGKVVWLDPRVAGHGQVVAVSLYVNPQLGPEYFKELVANQPLIVRTLLSYRLL